MNPPAPPAPAAPPPVFKRLQQYQVLLVGEAEVRWRYGEKGQIVAIVSAPDGTPVATRTDDKATRSRLILAFKRSEGKR